MAEGNSEEKEMSPREKAELAMSWATTHVAHPCGGTPEEKEYMKGVHIRAVREALKEPGVRDTLAETEKEILKIFGVDEEEP